MADLIYSTREAAPEAIRSLLAEEAGKFVLKGGDSAEVPGYEPATRVNEFRTNNITLKQEIDALKASAKVFEGLDPVKAREALKRVTELEQGNVDKLPAGVKELLQRQADEFKALKDQFAAEKTARAQAEDNLAEAALLDDLRKHLAPFVADGAVTDAVNRVRPLFVKGEDRKFRPVENGTPLLSTKNAGQPLTIEELVAAKIVNNPEARHLLKQSSGGRLNGGQGGPVGAGQVSWGDAAAISANLEDIAAGKVAVVA